MRGKERSDGNAHPCTNHEGTHALLFALAHPRWECVFQPKRAAYLNLIEPWWKNRRSLAFSGQCFASWEDVCEAVKKAPG